MAAAFVVLSILWVASYRFVDPQATILMGMRQMEDQTIAREWRSLDQISPRLVQAVIAAEDTRFCQHQGFDVAQIRAALDAATSGERLRGASTISQQTAKNVFLWPGRSFARKGLEVWFTFWMEALWPKERILEIYLNVAEWGDGHFGAEAAAQARFGHAAAELTTREAALLAAVLPNPAKWRVDPPGPYVRGRAATLQTRMAQVRAQGLDGCVTR